MKRILIILPVLMLCGCTLLRTDMVPKPVWAWDPRAKLQRQQDAEAKARLNYHESDFSELPNTPRATDAALEKAREAERAVQ